MLQPQGGVSSCNLCRARRVFFIYFKSRLGLKMCYSQSGLQKNPVVPEYLSNISSNYTAPLLWFKPLSYFQSLVQTCYSHLQLSSSNLIPLLWTDKQSPQSHSLFSSPSALNRYKAMVRHGGPRDKGPWWERNNYSCRRL